MDGRIGKARLSWGPKMPSCPCLCAFPSRSAAVVGTKDPGLQLRSGGHMPRTGACDYSTRYMARGHSHVQGSGGGGTGA